MLGLPLSVPQTSTALGLSLQQTLACLDRLDMAQEANGAVGQLHLPQGQHADMTPLHQTELHASPYLRQRSTDAGR
jgi:hypothetical protein